VCLALPGSHLFPDPLKALDYLALRLMLAKIILADSRDSILGRGTAVRKVLDRPINNRHSNHPPGRDSRSSLSRLLWDWVSRREA
jgi:hypothetical protein